MEKIEPKPPEDLPVKSLENRIQSFTPKRYNYDMSTVWTFLLNRLRENTTWIGVILSGVGIPAGIEDPVSQVIVALISIAMFFVREAQSEDSAPKKKEK